MQSTIEIADRDTARFGVLASIINQVGRSYEIKFCRSLKTQTAQDNVAGAFERIVGDFHNELLYAR